MEVVRKKFEKQTFLKRINNNDNKANPKQFGETLFFMLMAKGLRPHLPKKLPYPFIMMQNIDDPI